MQHFGKVGIAKCIRVVLGDQHVIALGRHARIDVGTGRAFKQESHGRVVLEVPDMNHRHGVGANRPMSLAARASARSMSGSGFLPEAK